MLAMGIPLKDKKHVIALYEFSKPVKGVKIIGELVNIESHTTKLTGLMINGKFETLSSCVQECGNGQSWGFLEDALPCVDGYPGHGLSHAGWHVQNSAVTMYAVVRRVTNANR